MLALFQHGLGRVGLYGDSNCLDSSHSRSRCFALLASMLKWAAGEVSRAPQAVVALRCVAALSPMLHPWLPRTALLPGAAPLAMAHTHLPPGMHPALCARRMCRR